MIQLIFGDNSYKKQQELSSLLENFSSQDIERYDGSKLTPDFISQLLTSASLFSNKRLIILREVSSNKSAWEKLGDVANNDDDEITTILLEDEIDKRTKTYKLLQKNKNTIECRQPTEVEAMKWLQSEYRKLSSGHAKLIIQRVGLNQMKLYFALEKVKLLNNLTDENIKNIIDSEPEAKIFEVIDAVIQKNLKNVQELMVDIKALEDPHRFFGMFVSQFFNLVTLSVSNKSPKYIAIDLSVHPYPLQKMERYAKKISQKDRTLMIEAVADADYQLKSSSAEPWQIVETLFLKLCR